MKRSTDYPGYEEYRNFRLKNEQRPYFGLDIINEQWDEVLVKEGTTVFYEGNIIKKIITWENFRFYEYREIDTELMTENKQFILPKTSKGKIKKITPTNLLGFTPTGCTVYISLYPLITAWCSRNNIELPVTDYKEIKTISDIKEWLENYIKTCPKDYFDKVQKMRTMPHRTIKYNVGDIFRFEIDRENYGYGLIIGKLRELIKQGVFPADHPMQHVMTIPIMIRLYAIKTKDKNLSVDEISKCELLPADLMCDNQIIWGTHEIVGSKTISKDDIDFPIQIGYKRNEMNIGEVYFAWEIGMKRIEQIDYEKLPEKIKDRNLGNSGVALTLSTKALDRRIKGESEYNKYSDLLHPENYQLKEMIFKMFDLP